MTTYSYYPGCSLHGMAKEYDRSLRLAAGKVGVELKELEDWSCCGSTAAHSTDELLSLSLAARNLRLAGETGLPMLAPCTMCFSRMNITQHALQDSARRAEVEHVLADTIACAGRGLRRGRDWSAPGVWLR